MSDLTRHVILNHVDSPLKWLVWTTGEVCLFVAPLFLGLFFNQLIAGCIISFVNFRLSKVYKQRFGKEQLQAVSYWFLPHAFKRYPAIPPSYIREYTG